VRYRAAKVNRSLLLTLASLLAWPLSAPCSSIEDILNRVAISPPASVAFREERHNSMLQEPLVLSGYMEYLAPGRMKKVIETPFSEILTISENAIRIERDGKVENLSLRRSRSLRTLLRGIVAVIAGDENHLVETFELELQQSPDGWSIHFTPRSKRIARNLESMSVHGSSDVIDSIRISLAGGEWHKIELLQDLSDS
jgi:hypothetical protein